MDPEDIRFLNDDAEGSEEENKLEDEILKKQQEKDEKVGDDEFVPESVRLDE